MSRLVLRLPVALAVALLVPMAVAGLLQQLGAWTAVPAVPSLLVGMVLGVVVARSLPVPAVPSRAYAGIGLLAAAFGVWVALTHGEHVVVRRDPGAYATYALSLVRFGGVPLDPQLDVFGLAQGEPWVRTSSAANYTTVQDTADGPVRVVSPQFLVGMPAVLSIGWWLAGWTGLFLVPAVVSAVVLVAFGALAAAVVGPRWAVLAVGVLALAQPFVLVSRQTFSEPLSMLYLLTSATVVVLAVRARADARVAARLGLLGGALLAANLFVRIDAYREIVLLVPLAAVLVGIRHPAGRGLLAGAALTGVPAALATSWWDSVYVADVASSLRPLLLAGAVLTVLSVLGVLGGRWLAGRWSAGAPAALLRVRRAAPDVVAGLLCVSLVALASRPLWLVDRREPYINGQDTFVEGLQGQQGLPLDGTRTYAENSVTWLAWWLGPVLLVLAAVVAVVAVRRALTALLRGDAPAWALPLGIVVAVSLLALYRSAITPDHPWADRRYVTVTLPALVLLATVGVAAVAERVRRVGVRPARAVVALLCAALLLPAAAPTLPMLGARTELGQVAAAEEVCASLREAGPRPAVLAVAFRARVEWTPVVRARCGVPVVGITDPGSPTEETRAEVLRRAAAGARAQGYTPVLFAGDEATARQLASGLDVSMEQVVRLETTEPARLLTERPTTTQDLYVEAWVAPAPG